MVHSPRPPANPQHRTPQTEEVFVVPDPPLCSTSQSLPGMTTRTSERGHQRGSHNPYKSPGQRKTYKQTEHEVGPSALWSSYSWKSHWQLDLHLWIWLWFWMEDRGPCPGMTPVTVLVMALIATRGLWVYQGTHDYVWVLLVDENNRFLYVMEKRWTSRGSAEYFWMIHGGERHKMQSIQSLWCLHPLSSISHLSLVEDKEGF